jgi:hypothetical protein
VDETGIHTISSPVEAESVVRCMVYNLADISSPMRYIVVVVATISEMMNCVLEWSSQLMMITTTMTIMNLIFRHPTPSNISSIRSRNLADGMSIREDEHVRAVTVIRSWKECDLDTEIGRI